MLECHSEQTRVVSGDVWLLRTVSREGRCCCGSHWNAAGLQVRTVKKTQVRSVTPFFKVVFFKIACQSQRFRQGGCKQPNVRGHIGRNYWFACKANQAYANLDNLFVTSARPRKTSNRPSWKSSALVCLPASIWAWAGTSPLAHFPEQASDSHRPTSHELLYWSSLQKFQNKNTDSKCIPI